MFVHEVINPIHIPLRATNTIAEGLAAMQDQGVEVIAVIDFTTNRLLGTVSRDDLEKQADLSLTLLSALRRNPLSISAQAHIFDALRILHGQPGPEDTAVVTEQDKSYSGIVYEEQLEKAALSLLNPRQEGGTVMVEVSPGDYSLMDLVRIVELEGAKILGLGVQPPSADQQRFRITLKLNQEDIHPVLHVLNRYGYVITSKSEDLDSDADLHDKADEFLRFLNI